jgi:hypothetical protein
MVCQQCCKIFHVEGDPFVHRRVTQICSDTYYKAQQEQKMGAIGAAAAVTHKVLWEVTPACEIPAILRWYVTFEF